MFHRHHGLPDDWVDIVTEHLAVWSQLDATERETLEANADWLLRHKGWEPAYGFALDDEIRVTIAAQAAIVILGLTVDHYREVGSIIVYPTTMVSRGVRGGPVPGTVSDDEMAVLGEAHQLRGPVLVAWDEADRNGRQPDLGENVVYHEFAHKLDMLDDLVDGTPPLPSSAARTAWIEACTPVFEALRRGQERPPLRPYGATNPGEFFAVATEAFFCVPQVLAHHEPALYDALRSSFNQNPLERSRSAARG